MTTNTPREHNGDNDRVEALLRELTAEDAELVAPPADLWAGIETQLHRDEDHAGVISLDRRRRFSRRIATITAIAAALVMVVGITVVVQRDHAEPTLIARADLAYDPVKFDELGAHAAARVALVDDDGKLFVEFDKSDLPRSKDESTDLELWLIHPDADGNPAQMVSLGLVDPRKPGEFEVPAAYDPTVYFVVDISVEVRDGNASHSGRSILRGPLTKV
ncbi:MAG: anti-sigma factor [Acidimicrobiales bacterium]